MHLDSWRHRVSMDPQSDQTGQCTENKDNSARAYSYHIMSLSISNVHIGWNFCFTDLVSRRLHSFYVLQQIVFTYHADILLYFT
jgi:hypothetical protein